MPADGTAAEDKITIFNNAGFEVNITGYARKGNTITIYTDNILPDPQYTTIRPNFLEIPYSGTNGCSNAYAKYGIGLGEDIRYSASGNGIWEMDENGRAYMSMEFHNLPDGITLDAIDEFTVYTSAIACTFDGDWTIIY